MVGGGRVLARKDCVTEIAALAGEPPAILLYPARQAGHGKRLFGVEPPAMRRGGAAIRIVGQWAAGTGVGASGIAMGRGQRLGDLGTGAKAGIDQLVSLQPIERLLVERGPPRLHDWLAVDHQPEPFKILVNARDKFGPAAAWVEVFDPQQEFAAARPALGMAEHGRKGVAEVKPSRGRGGETCDLQDSLHAKGDRGDS